MTSHMQFASARRRSCGHVAVTMLVLCLSQTHLTVRGASNSSNGAETAKEAANNQSQSSVNIDQHQQQNHASLVIKFVHQQHQQQRQVQVARNDSSGTPTITRTDKNEEFSESSQGLSSTTTTTTRTTNLIASKIERGATHAIINESTSFSDTPGSSSNSSKFKTDAFQSQEQSSAGAFGRDTLAQTSTSTAATTTTTSATTTTTTTMTTPTTTAQYYESPDTAGNLRQPHCTLGDDTFQIGERWNPNLPPFGVQVCVLCECTVRSRKSCYETKVTCRRITNECPIIDSCPDGKRPMTQPGQCCKSCQSQSLLSPAYEPTMQQQQQQQQQLANQTTTSFKIVYINERTKDYLSMIRDLPACLSQAEAVVQPPAQLLPVSAAASTQSPGAASVVVGPIASKNAKSTRNDLNGIDTKLAFKSLHDSTPHIFGSSSRNTETLNGAKLSSASVDHSSSSSSRRRIVGPGGGSSIGAGQHQAPPADADQQHPNDVQLATQNPLNTLSNKQFNQYANGNSNHNAANSQPQNSCLLGNETFQVGDIWRPVLPPHGVQVCVQCNCIFRVRRGCYETKVTCRRTQRDCPVIDVCPDGQQPVLVEGQCCKSCPPSSTLAPSSSSFSSVSSLALANIATSNVMIEQQQQKLNSLPMPETIQRNEKLFREFQNVSKNLIACVKNRESVDIYQTNRYAKRSHSSSNYQSQKT